MDKKSEEGEKPVKLCNYVDVYYNDSITAAINFMEATATEAQIERFTLRIGDVVITKDSESPDDIGVPSVVTESIADLVCGYHLTILRPNEKFLFGNYLFYALASRHSAYQFYLAANGVTRFGLTYQGTKNVRIAFPPVAEQQQIAAFLDWKTGQIDALIAKKKELLEKLKEKRLAVITQAVTKGINPSAPLRDSGIPWLGQVPEHWEVTCLRWFLRTGSGDFLSNEDMERSSDEQNFVPVVGGNGIMGYTSVPNTDANCLVAGRVGAHCGNIHLIREKCWVTDNALRVTTIDNKIDPEFLYWLLKSMNLNDDANRNAQPLITGETVKSKKVTLPPFFEQQFIADYLAQQTKAISMMQTKIESAIARLTEYRTALITAATTGKIDVRNIKIEAAA